MKSLSKTNGGETRKPNFVVFLAWSALIVDGLVILAWNKISCLTPAEVVSFVFLVLFKNGPRRVKPIFHLYISDVH